MLVLFDQGTPVPLRPHLMHHTVRTATEQEWGTLSNGELLTAAEASSFSVFVTTDKNLRSQLNLAGRQIAIVVIGYARWPGLELHVNRVVAAVNEAAPGSYAEIDIPIP